MSMQLHKLPILDHWKFEEKFSLKFYLKILESRYIYHRDEMICMHKRSKIIEYFEEKKDYNHMRIWWVPISFAALKTFEGRLKKLKYFEVKTFTNFLPYDLMNFSLTGTYCIFNSIFLPQVVFVYNWENFLLKQMWPFARVTNKGK